MTGFDVDILSKIIDLTRSGKMQWSLYSSVFKAKLNEYELSLTNSTLALGRDGYPLYYLDLLDGQTEELINLVRKKSCDYDGFRTLILSK